MLRVLGKNTEDEKTGSLGAWWIITENMVGPSYKLF